MPTWRACVFKLVHVEILSGPAQLARESYERQLSSLPDKRLFIGNQVRRQQPTWATQSLKVYYRESKAASTLSLAWAGGGTLNANVDGCTRQQKNDDIGSRVQREYGLVHPVNYVR
jgi:hypothetical protein